MWGNLSKLNLCTYHPVHCQALYTALRGTSTVLRQLSAAPELPLDEHLVTRFHIGIAPKKSFFRDSGSVWDFFVWLLFPLSSIVFSLENHPAAVRSSDLTSVRLPYAAVRGEVDSLGAELLRLYLTNYSSTGKTVVSAYAPGELKGVIQKVWSRYSLYPQSIATRFVGGVHRAQAKHEQNWVLGGFPTSDALLH